MANPFYKLDTYRVEVHHAAFGEGGDMIAIYHGHTQLIDALEAAYKATQNVHSDWVESNGQFNVLVEPVGRAVKQGGCRSTSVGDYMTVTDSAGNITRWNVAGCGFDEVK